MIGLDRRPPADQNRAAAEEATVRSFVNSYLREIDGGRSVFHRIGGQNVDCIEPALNGAHRLRFEVKSRSHCGMHRFGRIWQREGDDWREIAPLLAIHLIIHHYGGKSACPDLLENVLVSCGATHRLLDAATVGPARAMNFLDGEQGLYFGHPLHPTPKSIRGMTSWQRQIYAPEHSQQFQLVFFDVCESLYRQDAAGAETVSILDSLLGADVNRLRLPAGRRLIPQHPLQAEALLLEPAIQALVADGRLRPLGAAGHKFSATSSVRTLYSEKTPWMPKFSLPVRITNSKRVNRRFELDDAVAVALLFDRAGLNNFNPRLKFMHDRAYATIDIPGHAESGFEVIFRDGSLIRSPDDPIVTVSALTAEPLPGQQSMLERSIRALSASSGLPSRRACLLWFAAYLDCALEPALTLYDRHGIAIEAHQQNSLLDLSGGVPKRMLYRDSQGFYIAERMRSKWTSVSPLLEQAQGVFHGDADIRERFGYYLVVNQIFAVIARMGHDGLVPESELLGILAARLREISRGYSQAGRALIDFLLYSPEISAKANLRLRLGGIDEIGEGRVIYARFPNPLNSMGTAVASEAIHAIAS